MLSTHIDGPTQRRQLKQSRFVIPAAPKQRSPNAGIETEWIKIVLNEIPVPIVVLLVRQKV